MSLKVFHVIFIIVSVTLALFCAVWAFSNNAHPAFGYGSAITALALVIYGVWFLRKARNIIV
jgi:uncharacterized membrane protein SirB2